APFRGSRRPAAAAREWSCRFPESSALPEEFLDRVVDGLSVFDLRGHERFLFAELFFQVLDELAAAVRAFDLAVAEQVDARQDVLAQQPDAFLGVATAPVVAVREMERVNVPVA